MTAGRKRPRTVAPVPAAKMIPARRHELHPEPPGNLVVRFGRLDLDGPWPLTRITPEEHRQLLERLSGYETMAPEAVFNQNQGGKDYPVDRLPNREARERLTALEYDDADRISRLRIGGRQRLYGFRRGNEFYALWWDPGHVIWPSTKD